MLAAPPRGFLSGSRGLKAALVFSHGARSSSPFTQLADVVPFVTPSHLGPKQTPRRPSRPGGTSPLMPASFAPSGLLKRARCRGKGKGRAAGPGPGRSESQQARLRRPPSPCATLRQPVALSAASSPKAWLPAGAPESTRGAAPSPGPERRLRGRTPWSLSPSRRLARPVPSLLPPPLMSERMGGGEPHERDADGLPAPPAPTPPGNEPAPRDPYARGPTPYPRSHTGRGRNPGYKEGAGPGRAAKSSLRLNVTSPTHSSGARVSTCALGRSPALVLTPSDPPPPSLLSGWVRSPAARLLIQSPSAHPGIRARDRGAAPVPGARPGVQGEPRSEQHPCHESHFLPLIMPPCHSSF